MHNLWVVVSLTSGKFFSKTKLNKILFGFLFTIRVSVIGYRLFRTNK